MTSANDIHQEFDAALRSTTCPACELPYSDAAVQWCNGWLAGRYDLMKAIGGQERDGPVHIRCEMCGTKASFDIFTTTATALPEDV
jgi:hypothetical protein